MNRPMLRRTLVGGAIVGVVFAGVSIFQAMRSGASFPRVLQPIGVFTLIGFTIGALVGPLVAQALGHLGRDRRKK